MKQQTRIKLFDGYYIDVDEINDFLDNIEYADVDIKFELVNGRSVAVVKYQVDIDPLNNGFKKYEDMKSEVEKESVDKYSYKSDIGFSETITNGIPDNKI